MKYRDFRLQIAAGPGSGYTVHAWSPRGEGRAPFVLPFRPEEAAALRKTLRWSVRDLAKRGGADLDGSPHAIGERLFTALFSGEILGLYGRSLDLLGTNPEAGLRFELELSDPSLAAFQALPWELLRQPGTPDSLALSRRRSIVRYLPIASPVYEVDRPAVLRIVAVAANPRRADLSPLDLARELRHLSEAVGSVSALDLVTPPSPTLAALRQTLLRQECHVLHFMGHGGMVPGQEERILLFETENGQADPVRGTDLANTLNDFPTLRLAVLNACQSASVPSEDWESAPAAGMDFDPFAGVANTLMLGGLPAVIAMQLPISDHAAIAFSRAFYQRLAAGDPVDAAVAEGRHAVYEEDLESFEWAAPVLFTRVPNGDLFPPPPPRLWELMGILLLSAAVGVGLFSRPSFVSKAPQESLSTSPLEQPVEVTLQDGKQTTLFSNQVSLAVRFNRIEQESFVTVFVNGKSNAVISAGVRIPFTAGGGSYFVDVLEIDTVNRSVRLRVTQS